MMSSSMKWYMPELQDLKMFCRNIKTRTATGEGPFLRHASPTRPKIGVCRFPSDTNVAVCQEISDPAFEFFPYVKDSDFVYQFVNAERVVSRTVIQAYRKGTLTDDFELQSMSS